MWEGAHKNVSETEDTLAWCSALDHFLSHALILTLSVKQQHFFPCCAAEAELFPYTNQAMIAPSCEKIKIFTIESICCLF